MANLRVGRVKTIMKTSDGVDMVSKDAVWLVTRATEFFLKNLAIEAYHTTKNSKKLQYENLIDVIHKCNEYEFLQIMVPKKITVSEYRKLMDKMQKRQKLAQAASDNKNKARSSDAKK